MVRMRRQVPAGAQASQEPITVRRAISDALGFVIDLAIAEAELEAELEAEEELVAEARLDAESGPGRKPARSTCRRSLVASRGPHAQNSSAWDWLNGRRRQAACA